MDDLVTKARDFASRDTACGRWINALADALEAEIRSRENWQATAAAAQEALEAERQLRAKWEIEAQDLRDRAVQLESWVAQARPVIEAVRAFRMCTHDGFDDCDHETPLHNLPLPTERP